MGYTVVVISLSCFSVSPFSPSRSSYSCKLDFVVPARETGGALRLNRGSGNQTYGGRETRWKWERERFCGLVASRGDGAKWGPEDRHDARMAYKRLILSLSSCARTSRTIDFDDLTLKRAV